MSTRLQTRTQACPPACQTSAPLRLPAAALQRAVLTRSDLKDADIYGADFTNALLDKTQQMVGGV